MLASLVGLWVAHLGVGTLQDRGARLHAAENSGTLPAALSEISVPLPSDPVTGKPFVYTVERATAHLRGRSHRGATDDPESGIHYQVVLRK